MARAGELRKRVSFERRDVADDGGGGGAVHWTSTLVVWGSLTFMSGHEMLAAGRLESASVGTLRIRSSRAARAIDASYSVTIDGDRYNIRGIGNPDSRNRILEFTVEAGVAA